MKVVFILRQKSTINIIKTVGDKCTNPLLLKFLCFSFRFPLYEFFVDEGNANNEHKVTLNKKQGNYPLRRPPKLIIPKIFTKQRWATVYGFM